MKRDLSRLPLELDGGPVRVVIETPMGSFNKYDYNPKLDAFELKGGGDAVSAAHISVAVM